jgi:hypothetical protein
VGLHRDDGTTRAIHLNQKLKNYPHYVWENLIGCNVEVVVMGDEAVNVYDVTKEEE